MSLVARGRSTMNFMACAPATTNSSAAGPSAWRSSGTYVLCGSGIIRCSIGAESRCRAAGQLVSGHTHLLLTGQKEITEKNFAEVILVGHTLTTLASDCIVPHRSLRDQLLPAGAENSP